MRLYPTVERIGQSFEGITDEAVPNQSMTLEEILKRFIKNQPLPIENEDAHYNDFHDEIDLEKLEHEDDTVKSEVLENLKRQIYNMRKHLNLDEEGNELPNTPGISEPPRSPMLTQEDMAKSAGGSGAGEGPR